MSSNKPPLNSRIFSPKIQGVGELVKIYRLHLYKQEETCDIAMFGDRSYSSWFGLREVGRFFFLHLLYRLFSLKKIPLTIKEKNH